MPDTINLDIDYFDHPKVRRLIGILGPGSETHHIRLMCYLGRHRPGSGGFDDWSAEEIESAADWRGEKSKMVEAMVRCGLLHEKNGGYYIHDWKARQPHLVKYEKTKRERQKAAESRWKKERRVKNQCNDNVDKEINLDANDDAKRDFAFPKNEFCITNAVQCSAVTTYTSACENFEAGMSPTYEHVLDVFKKVTGRKAKDAATKEGARELARAIDAGDLERTHLAYVIKEGMNDPALPSQTLRGVSRNFGNYLPAKTSPGKHVNRHGTPIGEIIAQQGGSNGG